MNNQAPKNHEKFRMYSEICNENPQTVERSRERDLADGISAKDENVGDRGRETRFLGESRETKMEIQINLWEIRQIQIIRRRRNRRLAIFDGRARTENQITSEGE